MINPKELELINLKDDQTVSTVAIVAKEDESDVIDNQSDSSESAVVSE